MSATIRTTIADLGGERRVFFEMPATGFGLHELDALEVAIRLAREQLVLACQSEVPEKLRPPECCGG